MCAAIRPGARFGRWTIVGELPLGEGKNGEVWKGEDDDGELVAIKFLHPHRLGTPSHRFLDEIKVLREIGRRDGVVPLVDSHVPEQPSEADRPWLATRLAIPLEQALANRGGRLEAVVEAIHSVAAALATLHQDGIMHRDIKPDNLFLYEEKGAVGDFGLVTYPDKESHTESSEKLGPSLFIPPEMFTDPVAADPKAADVYSLAKTLWVLATGHRYPFLGELRRDTPQVRLSTYVTHQDAPLLDLLLERATRHDPQMRGTMGDFASELEAWLTPIPGRKAADVSHLGARFRPAIDEAKASRASWDEQRERVKHISRDMEGSLADLASRIGETTGLHVSVPGNNIEQHLLDTSRDTRKFPSRRSSSIEVNCPTKHPLVTANLMSGFALLHAVDGSCVLRAAHLVSNGYGQRKSIGKVDLRFPIGSAKEKQAVAECLQSLEGSLPEALRAFVDILDDPDS